jgi:aspartate aminotransferase
MNDLGDEPRIVHSVHCVHVVHRLFLLLRELMVPRKFAARMEGVGLSMIRQVMLKAAGCVNLGIGEPEFFAPDCVLDAAHQALEQDRLGYSPNVGLPELCEAVRRHHGDLPGTAVCITNGSQEALFDAFFALLDPGDQVLVPDPGFVAYPIVARLAGAETVSYPLNPEKGFSFDFDALESRISSRTRIIVLNTPSNPTGRSIEKSELKSVARLAEKTGAVIISDEIYRDVYFTPNRPASLAEVSDQAVILSGVSKMASMTGWRLGWACGPVDIIRKVTVMHQYTSSCASTLSQRAALALFTERGAEELARLRRRLGANRDLLCALLSQDGRCKFVTPEAAIYLMLDVRRLGKDSLAVALELIQDGVATIPGSAFGRQGEGFLRLSFGSQPDRIREGAKRVKSGLQRLGA